MAIDMNYILNVLQGHIKSPIVKEFCKDIQKIQSEGGGDAKYNAVAKKYKAIFASKKKMNFVERIAFNTVTSLAQKAIFSGKDTCMNLVSKLAPNAANSKIVNDLVSTVDGANDNAVSDFVNVNSIEL